MTACEREIDVLVRARYPLIFVVSCEEERVGRLMYRLSQSQNKTLHVWSATTGMHKYGEKKRDEVTRDPLAALEYIEKQTGALIFLAKDFHPYLNDPTITRKLRDLVQNLKGTYETLVLLSPILNIPPEIEKDIAVVDFSLPDKEEIGRLLDEIVASVSAQGNITVDIPPEVREKLLDAALGLTLNEAENAFARAIVTDKRFDEKDIEMVLAEKRQVIRKTGILDYFHTDESIGGVGGLDILKDWLSTRSAAFTQKAKDFGLLEPKGILLVGVQGCGKSLTAKAVSNLWRLPLLRFDVGKVFSGIVGSSEENMRKAISIAESIAPVVLWIDEIEKSLSGVQSSSFSDAGTSARVFGTFITWLQEKTRPVFVVATANNVRLLPAELLRKGRFDEIFFVDLPSVREREAIFSIHLRKRKRDPAAFDIALLAGASESYSGAEIEQAVISGLFEAFVSGRELSTEDILKGIRETVPLSVTMKEEIVALREWAGTRARPASRAADAEPPTSPGRKLEIHE